MQVGLTAVRRNPGLGPKNYTRINTLFKLTEIERVGDYASTQINTKQNANQKCLTLKTKLF